MERKARRPNFTRTVCMIVSNDMVNDPRVSRHAETLGAHGFSVIVVCPISERTEPHEIKETYEIMRPRSALLGTVLKLVTREYYKSSWNRKAGIAGHEPHGLIKLVAGTGSFFLTQLALLRTAKKQRAQVYCANDFDTLLVTILAAGLDRCVVYDSHELWPDMMLMPQPIKTIARAAEKLLVKRADIVMATTEFQADELRSRFSLPNRPQVIYNCPSKESHATPKSKRKGLKIALYQGRYLPDRGLENLVLAADHLLPDVRLVLRGFGAIEQNLRSLSVGRTKIRFAEPVSMSKLVSAAKEADIGIVSMPPTSLNNYFACPNKLFEYISAGLPVVSSDTPFLRKIILKNDIGTLFDARDPQSIADAINRSTRDPILKRQRANLAAVAAKYNWENESEKLLQAYANLS